MDAELKSFLEGMEARLNSRIGQAVAESEQRLRTHLDEVVAQSEQRSNAHTEIVETRLLSEFWKWARTTDARYRQNQAIVGGLDIRVQTIEDRVSDIEQRLAS